MLKLIFSYVTVLSLVIFLSHSSNAQETFVGVKGGISIPSLVGGSDNEISRDYKSRVSTTFGMFIDIGVTDRFSVQPEINFEGNGGKRTGIQPITQSIPGLPPLPSGTYFYADFKNTAILNYLEFPVLLKYKFGSKDRNRFYLNGGLAYGRLLNAKTVTKGSSTIFLDKNRTPLLLPPLGTPLPPVSFDAETNIENDIHKNNLEVVAGGGIEFPHRKNYFLVDARVYYGLSNIQRDVVANGKSHTGNLVISFGYAFGVKK